MPGVQLSYRMNGMPPRARQRNGAYPGSAGPAIRCMDRKKVGAHRRCSLGAEFDTLMITGPNTGGKTVALKTVGLLITDGPVRPAYSGGRTAARISVFSQVLADIGDEQCIEQSPLHLLRPHDQYRRTSCTRRMTATLALFDELGAGTDPVEGAALADGHH